MLHNKTKSEFIRLFNSEPLVINSPGRINLLGEHTDYNSGFVMPASINKGVSVAVFHSENVYSTIYSMNFKEYQILDLQNPEKINSPAWLKYFTGILIRLRYSGYLVRPFNCIINGDLPIGAGLSSSAAIGCGFLFALNELFDLKLSRIQMAWIAKWSENNYANVKCGIMDHFTNMMGIRDHAIFLDCMALDSSYLPLNMENYAILLCDTKITHNLAVSKYNKRKEECDEGLTLIKKYFDWVKSFRDVTHEMLLSCQPLLPPAIFKRCLYVIEENSRVQKASKDLLSMDLVHFAKKMYDSHEGLTKLFEVSCPELDFLVEQARASEHVLGSRMMGGGFGGCTINIVKEEAIDALIKTIGESNQKNMGMELTAYIAQVEDGTSLLS